MQNAPGGLVSVCSVCFVHTSPALYSHFPISISIFSPIVLLPQTYGIITAQQSAVRFGALQSSAASPLTGQPAGVTAYHKLRTIYGMIIQTNKQWSRQNGKAQRDYHFGG
jgi:hypothetical protein